MPTRTGASRYIATFEEHNGNRDTTGNPTYAVDADWRALPLDYYCMLETAGGGETLRGRQTTAETTHVLHGDFWAAQNAGIHTAMRVRVGSLLAGVVAVFDPDGLHRVMRVEVRTES